MSLKISTSMDYGANVGLTYPQTAEIMKQAGFQGIDLALCHGQDDPKNLLTDEWHREAVFMADCAKKAGLELAQCHLPYYPGHLELPGDGTPAYFESYMLPAYEQALKVCGEVGSIISAKVVEIVGTKIDIPRWKAAKQEIRELIEANSK